jgi:putative membrane protein
MMAEPKIDAAAPPSLDVVSAQFSWIRSDLSNLRTLLSWSRTAVSLIGFGFTIYNFFSGFLDDTGEARLREFSRNLGLTLVITGTLGMVLAVWNYWTINTYLEQSVAALEVPRHLKARWAYAYVLSGVLTLVGIITILFMLRVI